LATVEERAVLQAIVDGLRRPPLPDSKAVDDAKVGLWLPKLAAPERLYAAYVPSARDRLTTSAIEAADHDLQALALTPGLGEPAFRDQVADRFSTMPAVAAILTAAQSDLSDSAAVDLIETLVGSSNMRATARWQIVRDWLTYFLRDKYEIAPQSYVTRLRPGAGRE
jgi:hypothetical protein